MGNVVKICKRCGEEKSINLFYKAKANKDGYSLVCKKCKNIEHTLYSAKYRKTKEGKAVLSRASKKYLMNNPDKRREYRKGSVWKRYIKQYRQEEHYLNQQREYREANKEKNRIRNAEYMREYRKDPQKRMKYYLRNRVNRALKYQGVSKNKTTMELVGCSIEFLKRYIESLFAEGMTWDNYGEWHIDHIRPCVSFDLIDSEQQKKCFHYTNLQPLWWYENLSKGAKIVA